MTNKQLGGIFAGIVAFVMGSYALGGNTPYQSQSLPLTPPARTAEPVIPNDRPTAIRLKLPTGTPTATKSPTSTETLTPTVMPTATPYVTTDQNVNLRSGPGTNYDVIGSLKAGDKLPVTGRKIDSTWWQVSSPAGTAWVAASVVTVENFSDEIRLTSIPPTPTVLPALPSSPPNPAMATVDTSKRLQVVPTIPVIVAPAPSSGSGGMCCKYCGPNSKPCGDSCISKNKNCHKGRGCAC